MATTKTNKKKLCDFGLARGISENTALPKPKSHKKLEITAPFAKDKKLKKEKKKKDTEEKTPDANEVPLEFSQLFCVCVFVYIRVCVCV